MNEIIKWIAIKKLPKIGDVSFNKLLKEHTNINDIFNLFLNKKELDQCLNFAEKEYKKSRELGIKFLTYYDDFYPVLLKETYAPPPFLYYFGKKELFKTKEIIAIVGSRNPSDYGKNICSDIVKGLTEYNITTVSGFARGIDTIVHKETLKYSGNTIAVLGCGLNIIYPASNRKLFDDIKEKGLIISEFFLDTKPEAGNFPKRNRIISGISKGVVVVEATKKSGSLITANFALEQNREVFAIPGNVYNYKSRGTNYLIKKGAYLIENAEDVVEILFPYKKKRETVEKSEINFESSEVEEIYNIIKENPVIDIDNIVIMSKRSIVEISPILMQLEISGFIKEETGKKYVAIK